MQYRVEWIEEIEMEETFSTLQEARNFVEDLFQKGVNNWRLFEKKGSHSGRSGYYLIDSGEIINSEDELDASMETYDTLRSMQCSSWPTCSH